MEIDIDLDRKRYSFLNTFASSSHEIYLNFKGRKLNSMTGFSYFLYFNDVDIQNDSLIFEDTQIISLPSARDTKRFVFKLENLLPDSDYVLNIKVFEDDNDVFDKNVLFTTDKPDQPFPSWTWNEHTLEWESPKPHPEDGQGYIWDEEAQEWELTEIIS